MIGCSVKPKQVKEVRKINWDIKPIKNVDIKVQITREEDVTYFTIVRESHIKVKSLKN